jgi:hypothetical protein
VRFDVGKGHALSDLFDSVNQHRKDWREPTGFNSTD